MALTEPTPEQVKDVISELNRGQELLVDYYGSNEKAYFISALSEPEHKGKILVLLEDRYQQDVIDIDSGQVLAITDDIPYSEVRLNKMVELSPMITQGSSLGERPEVLGKSDQIIRDIYAQADALLQSFDDIEALDDDQARATLTSARDFLSVHADYAESPSDLETIESLEAILSERFNEKSLESANDDVIESDNSDQNTVGDDTGEVDVGETDKEDILSDEALDIGDRPIFEDELLNSSASVDDSSITDNTIDRPGDTLNQQVDYQGGIGLGQALMASARGILSLATYGGTALSNFAQARTEKGQQRLKAAADVVGERNFNSQVDETRALLSKIDSDMTLIRDDTVEGFLSKIKNTRGTDVEAEKTRQLASNDLRDYLDTPGSSDSPNLQNILSNMEVYTRNLHELNEYRDSADPSNLEKAKLIDVLSQEGSKRVDDLEELARGNKEQEERLRSMAEAIRNMIESIKRLLGIDQERATNNDQSMAPSPS